MRYVFFNVRLFTIFFVFILSIVIISCAEQEKKGGNTNLKTANTDIKAVGEITSAEQFQKLIESSKDRLLIFDLYADWCMPCKMLSPMLEEIAKENLKKASVYKINVDKHPGLARAFGVSGIPFVVYVKNGKGVHAFTGVQRKDVYVRAIDQFSQSEEKQPDISPDGKLIDGVRVIEIAPHSEIGKIYVHRGETIKLVMQRSDGPFALSIPQYNVIGTSEKGEQIEVSFKAKDIGVFSIYCNGPCPTGDGSEVGQIVVMQFKSEGHADYKELNASEAKTLIKEKNPLILDVRTPNEFYSGHIKGAKLIPLNQLEGRLSEIEKYKNREILIYCRSGNRSTVAAEIIIKKGFKKLYNLRPGIKGWVKEGFETVKK